MSDQSELDKDALRQWPLEKRLKLLDDLWSSLDGEAVGLPDWHRDVLDQRLEAASTQSGLPWREVLDNIQAALKK